jgi:hypothetical protein
MERFRVGAVAPVDGSDSPEVIERDERSMRVVEWVIALCALGAAIALAVR